MEIHKINLGRTCFDRVSPKSEMNNIFFRPYQISSFSADNTLNSFIKLFFMAKILTEILN